MLYSFIYNNQDTRGIMYETSAQVSYVEPLSGVGARERPCVNCNRAPRLTSKLRTGPL